MFRKFFSISLTFISLFSIVCLPSKALAEECDCECESVSYEMSTASKILLIGVPAIAGGVAVALATNHNHNHNYYDSYYLSEYYCDYYDSCYECDDDSSDYSRYDSHKHHHHSSDHSDDSKKHHSHHSDYSKHHHSRDRARIKFQKNELTFTPTLEVNTLPYTVVVTPSLQKPDGSRIEGSSTLIQNTGTVLFAPIIDTNPMDGQYHLSFDDTCVQGTLKTMMSDNNGEILTSQTTSLSETHAQLTQEFDFVTR